MEASKELTMIDAQLTQKDLDNWLLGTDTKLTDKQKKLFYQIALAFQLNPAKREIYAVVFGNNFNVITGYEVYLKRAERTGKLEYWDAGIKKENNEWIGWCKVKRTDRSEPTTIEAWFNEYNQGNRMWKEKPRTMIRKVAIAQAFRMSFPDELGGMPYTSDEMGEVVEAETVEEEKKTPTPTPNKKRSSHHEALKRSDEEVQEEWTSRQEDLADIIDLIEKTGTKEASILSYYKLPDLNELTKEQAGQLHTILADRFAAMSQ